MLKNIKIHTNIIKLINRINPKFFEKNPLTAEISSYLLYFVFIYSILVYFFKWENAILLSVIIIAIIITDRIFTYCKCKNIHTFFIQGMSREKGFPIDVLSKPIQAKIKNNFNLSVSDINDISLSKAIEIFKQDKLLIENIKSANKISQIYLCGFTRIPFLFLYGYLFHVISSKITYLEKSHSTQGWTLMDKKEKLLKIKGFNKLKAVTPNSKGQIGLALSFTYSIKCEHLPDLLQNHTLFLGIESPSRNQINNQANLEATVKDLVHKVIDNYSNEKAVSEIHLFIAAQTTVAIELGRNYQPKGMHKDIVIHNYDIATNSYTWALKISNEEVKIFTDA